MIILGLLAAFGLAFLTWRSLIGLLGWSAARKDHAQPDLGLPQLLILWIVTAAAWTVLGPFAVGSIDNFVSLIA